MLEQARRLLGARAAKARFEVVDQWRWTPAATWDRALACFFIEHVSDEVLPDLLRTLHRAVRPGGTAFMAERASFGAEPQVERREVGGQVFQVVECRRSRAQLSEAFETAGFTIDIAEVSAHVCLTGSRR
jgi:cyclopropane fatty-acyl-phospholipid synthase-like methyltransferase